MSNVTPPQTAEMGSVDYIYGAANIAEFLKIGVRSVYYFLELKKTGKGDAPIHKKPGLGIYASRQELIEYMKTGR